MLSNHKEIYARKQRLNALIAIQKKKDKKLLQFPLFGKDLLKSLDDEPIKIEIGGKDKKSVNSPLNKTLDKLKQLHKEKMKRPVKKKEVKPP